MTRIEGYRSRKEAGYCGRCYARPAAVGKRCQECAEKQREYNRLYMRRKRGTS